MNQFAHVLCLVLSLCTPVTAVAQTVTADSVLAVVTEKGGFAKGRAHDHLITAGPPRLVELAFDPELPLETRFRLEVKAEDLVVDDAQLRSTWGPRLEAQALLKEPFSTLDDRQRAKIRESMLGRKQLDAERYPSVVTCLVAVEEQPTEVAGKPYPFTVHVQMSVHGQTATASGGARILENGEGEGDSSGGGSGEAVRLEAVVPFHFTDFGIEPFSAFLGAVKNLDRFYLYANVGVP